MTKRDEMMDVHGGGGWSHQGEGMNRKTHKEALEQEMSSWTDYYPGPGGPTNSANWPPSGGHNYEGDLYKRGK